MRAITLTPLISAGPAFAADPVRPARYTAVARVGLTDARWTTGFWADRFATRRDTTVPAMGTLMAGTERSQLAQNFRIAAGLEAGKYRGKWEMTVWMPLGQ